MVNSIDFTMNFPKHVECVDAYNVLIGEFNPADMAPFYLLVKAKDQTPKSIWTPSYFESLCAIGTTLVDVDGGFENSTSMTSMGFAPSQYGNLSYLSATKNPTAAIAESLLAVNNPQLVPRLAPYVDTPYYAAFMGICVGHQFHRSANDKMLGTSSERTTNVSTHAEHKDQAHLVTLQQQPHERQRHHHPPRR